MAGNAALDFAPLLAGPGSSSKPPAPSGSQLLWRVMHVFNFLLGGSTFILGSLCYWFPEWPPAASMSAMLYTVGSLGFLCVDLQEVSTFPHDHFDGESSSSSSSSSDGHALDVPGGVDPVIRLNCMLSALGSTLYVIGSLGFFPSVAAAAPWVGAWGFLGGSLVIAASQLWKVARILSAPEGKDEPEGGRFTAAGVEASAGLGASLFATSTAQYMYFGGTPVGVWYWAIVWQFLGGSIGFTVGGLFLAYRHFGQGL